VLNLAIGALFAGAIALAAWRVRALTRSGAIAAFAVGTLTYASGTLGFTLVLLAFFVPSVLLSRIGRARKRELVDIGKHGARDAMQVLANGGIATVCAVVWVFTQDARWAFAFAGAFAAASADTWGTEIGTLARGQPRSILTLRPVPAGLSGGISLPGTLAEFAGAAWMGVAGLVGIGLANMLGAGDFGMSYLNDRYPLPPIVIVNPPLQLILLPVLAIPAAGILGAMFDSILGATLQELRWCDACGRACETDPHECGHPTRRVRGIPGFSNDAVNLLATAMGAAVAFVMTGLAWH
jgi:uncharacterized protein (TIGR00297 family)